jgi:hypothetical protein
VRRILPATLRSIYNEELLIVCSATLEMLVAFLIFCFVKSPTSMQDSL